MKKWNAMLVVCFAGLVGRGGAAPVTPHASENPPTHSEGEPTLFAPDVISTGDDEFGGSFTPNGDTVYFSKSAPHSYRYTMLESHRTNGAWTKPTVLPFSGRYADSDPTLSPDGTRLFWSSDRPVARGEAKHDYDIWMVERTRNDAWGAPQRLPAPINSNESEYAASMTRSGTLYFSSARAGGIQVFRARPIAGSPGKWSEAENVTRLLNQGDTTSELYDLDVMVDPDERFLILGSIRREGFGNFDLYAAWNENGRWTRPVHLPAPFNTRARDYAPHISPDGKTLYFASERGFGLTPSTHRLDYRELTTLLRNPGNGSGDIYAVPMQALDAFRPLACAPDAAAAYAWWTGTWDYFIPKYDPATSVVTASNGGCSLTEEYVDRGGAKMHVTIDYDDAKHEWHRVVTDPSRTYRSTGKFAADGSIAFYETPTDRETYRPTDGDHVHYIGEKSEDAGKTWHIWFDATYTRRR